MKNEAGKSKPYFMLALFTLLIIATLSLVLIGSSIYGSLVEDQSKNNQGRAVLAYLYAQIRAADGQNSIKLEDGPEGQALVFCENIGEESYETRIYLYEGKLVEEYAIGGVQYAPDKAQPVADESKFIINYTAANLLEITTGKGNIQVALRSAGGAEQ